MSTPADDPGDARPVKPLEPEAGACCQSGCDPCVYDLYWAAMDRYEQALAEWSIRHPAGRSEDAMTNG